MSEKGKKAKIIPGGRSRIQGMIDQEKNARIRDRLRAILWSNNQVSNSEIARRLNKNNATIGKWIKRWNKEEYAGLLDNHIPGRARILSVEEEYEIIEQVKNRPVDDGQGRITCKMLCARIEKVYGKRLTPETLRYYLKKNGLSWKKSGKYDYRRNDEHRQRFIWKLEETKKKSKGKRVNMVY